MQISSYLKLIRIPNLLFIVFIQFAMHQAVINPILQQYGFERMPVSLNLLLLIAATVFTAAGGYVLNDYFDVKIDAINKPEKQIISKTVNKESAMRFYQVLTFVGLVCGLLLSFRAKNFTLAFIFIFVPGLLWFYSSNYKRQFLVGNIVVAFISALSVLIVALAAVALFKMHNPVVLTTTAPRLIYGWIMGFSVFAFMLTWIRELIKDMEDEKGDREMECRTMPIKWGVKKTKIFLCFLILLTIVSLFWVYSSYIRFEGTLTLRYIIFGLLLPLIVLAYLVVRAKNKNDYHQASTFSKFIMLVGVLYAFVFYYLQIKMF